MVKLNYINKRPRLASDQGSLSICFGQVVNPATCFVVGICYHRWPGRSRGFSQGDVPQILGGSVGQVANLSYVTRNLGHTLDRAFGPKFRTENATRSVIV